jgi:hypothetical protein
LARPVELKKIIEEKIVAKEAQVYTAPPEYFSRGRGLVYNCKGGHWACVDKESYFQCRDNQKWQKKENKTIECHTINVYSGYKDCKIIQLHNIHTLVKTKFCGN